MEDRQGNFITRPINNSCNVCSRPIATNHCALFCYDCQKWTHIQCSDITPDFCDYLRRNGQDFDWRCPHCVLTTLPFHNASLSDSLNESLNSSLTLNMSEANNQRDESFCNLNHHHHHHDDWYCKKCKPLPNFNDSYFEMAKSPCDLNVPYNVSSSETSNESINDSISSSDTYN